MAITLSYSLPLSSKISNLYFCSATFLPSSTHSSGSLWSSIWLISHQTDFPHFFLSDCPSNDLCRADDCWYKQRKCIFNLVQEDQRFMISNVSSCYSYSPLVGKCPTLWLSLLSVIQLVWTPPRCLVLSLSQLSPCPSCPQLSPTTRGQGEPGLYLTSRNNKHSGQKYFPV